MEKKICPRCVMDNVGDPYITFDNNGYCNYCTDALVAKEIRYFPNDEGKRRLNNIFNKIKQDGKNKQYDCMLGLSGGLDSSYLAYIGHQYDLRMLAVHIDDGFDSLVTTQNVYKICEAYNIELVMEKPDREQFNDLTRAFLRAGVPNIAIPQDNVLFANLYKYAQKNKIKYFLNGSNFALESILQAGNTYDASDKAHILDIQQKFGEIKHYDKLPLFSMFEKRIKYGLIYKIETVRPLNFVDYNAKQAFSILNETCGFEHYGEKHCESVLTKFMQRYYLPMKFGVDKRKSHYSSMIVSNQMTRKEALERLSKPLYEDTELQNDLDYILKCLPLSRAEFDMIMGEPPHQHTDYKTSFINRVGHGILEIRQKYAGY